jgi:hypothetical protein
MLWNKKNWFPTEKKSCLPLVYLCPSWKEKMSPFDKYLLNPWSGFLHARTKAKGYLLLMGLHVDNMFAPSSDPQLMPQLEYRAAKNHRRNEICGLAAMLRCYVGWPQSRKGLFALASRFIPHKTMVDTTQYTCYNIRWTSRKSDIN